MIDQASLHSSQALMLRVLQKESSSPKELLDSFILIRDFWERQRIDLIKEGL